MRFSNYYIPTLKEDPKDAEIVSHKLMIRAGLIRKLGSGLYTYLPLGKRALRKVEEIVREEMDNAGALEFSFPLLVPVELWIDSGRWNPDKKELMRLKDRNDNIMVLSPTNEESFTDFFRKEFHSYKQLPVNFYQIGIKFRDEIRPRFGVMRAKEFLMKDAYSLDLDEESLDVSYKKMRDAYYNVFRRCMLDTISVKADSGDIGGDASEEFMVKSSVGEEEIVACECGYIANIETAESVLEQDDNKEYDLKTIEMIHTPNVKTIDDLVQFFDITAKKFIKSLVYKADNKSILVLIRGDYDINETKLKSKLGIHNLELADDETIFDISGSPAGFIGPYNLKKDIPIYADFSVKDIVNGITGANKKDFHYKNINPGRDFQAQYYDLRLVKKGDKCVHCGKQLDIFRGIEVGHIFKLGDKYSKAMGVKVLDKNGKEVTPLMGCYGIGITRTLAAIIEQHNDKDGIIWPITVAPFHVIITIVNTKNEELLKLAEKIENDLEKQGIEVLVDDRDLRPGFKFKDADLIGIPFRVNLSEKALNNNSFEIVRRKDKEIFYVSMDEIIDKLINLINIENKKER